MRVYLCPSHEKEQCSWEGHSDDILEHFEQEHEELLHYDEHFPMYLESYSENRLFLLSGEVYLVQIISEGSTLVLKLRYLGPQRLANKISYFIVIKGGGIINPSTSIATNPQGFLEVDISDLKKIYTGMKSVTCSLNITKEFADDESLDGVFVEKSIDDGHTNVENGNQTPKIVINDGTDSPDIFNENRKGKRNEYEEETGSFSKEIIEHIIEVETKLQEESNLFIDSSINNKIKSDNTSLHRSKSTAFEDTKRSWYRAMSTRSLRSIQELDQSLICMICKSFIKSPNFACSNGHHFCEKCRQKDCLICEEEVKYAKGSDLETIIQTYSLSPCKFHKYGCPEKLLKNDLLHHEINCLFCSYKCQLPECFYEGQFKGMCNHLRIIHGSIKLLTSFTFSFQHHSDAFLVNEEKGIFHCYVEYGQSEIEWHAIFFGPKERVFVCELKFKDGKVKDPVRLSKLDDHHYYVKKSVNDLKRMKIKPKSAILTITS